MRTAVMRVVVDAEGALPPEAYENGLARLRQHGVEVVASPVEHLPARDREIELILAEDALAGRDELVMLCSDVFGTPAVPGVVTYISRGTDDDALRVLQAFSVVDAIVERADDDELVVVRIGRASLERVAEGRLHTALEAALNCEVRIEMVAGR